MKLPILLGLLVAGAPLLHAQQIGIEQDLSIVTMPAGNLIAWYGHAGRSYFLQVSDPTDHLKKWNWHDIIEEGKDDEISHEVGGVSDKGFFRLQYTDQVPGPGETLDTADFDGDGISNLDEITSVPQTNPLNPDTDGDGLPDGWELAHGLNPTDSTDAASTFTGSTSTNLQAFNAGVQGNLNATLTNKDGDGVEDLYDADPNDGVINWNKTSDPKFVVIELPVSNLDGLSFDDVSPNGTVLFTRSSNSLDQRVLVDKHFIAHEFPRTPPRLGDPIGYFGSYAVALIGDNVLGVRLVAKSGFDEGVDEECLWAPLDNSYTACPQNGYHDDIRDDRGDFRVTRSFDFATYDYILDTPYGILDDSEWSDGRIEANGNIVSESRYWRYDSTTTSYGAKCDLTGGTIVRSATLIQEVANTQANQIPTHRTWNLVAGTTKLQVSTENGAFVSSRVSYPTSQYPVGVTSQGWVATANQIWSNGTWKPLTDLLSGNKPSQATLLGILDTGLGVAKIVSQTGQPKIVHLVPVDLAVDANRDGKITFDVKDKTTPEKPFRFWVNDDFDRYNQETSLALTGDKNSINTVLDGINDFEDTIPLKIRMAQDLVNLLRLDKAKLGFKWTDITAGTPSVRIYSGCPTSDSNDYLANRDVAIQHLADHNSVDRILVNSGATVWLRDDLYDDDFDNNTVNLLLEGCIPGTGKLTLVIQVTTPTGTQEVNGPSVDMKLLHVREMYERGKVCGNGGVGLEAQDIPGPWAGDPPAMSWAWDPWGAPPVLDPDADKTAIVFVHGWRVLYDEYLVWADTTYKRLWQLGYKGRFYTFRWPTFSGDNNGIPDVIDDELEQTKLVPGATTYNASEYRAWLSGPALADFVNQLPDAASENRFLIAHSMGNVVAGSALRAGMNVQRYAMCNSAMSAMAYDGSMPADPPVDLDTLGVDYTPDTDGSPFVRNTFGLADQFNHAAPEIVNFSLPNDAALGNWSVNNGLFKPQLIVPFWSGHGTYSYNPNALPASKLQYAEYTLRDITSVPEAMGYVTKSRTRAAGAKQNTGGSVKSFVNMGAGVGGFNFGTSHSAEWIWNYQKCYPFWWTVLQKFGMTPINRPTP